MAEPITKLEDLSAAQRRVIEANAGNELIPVSRDASGVITEYRQMSPQEYLTSKGGLTRAGYFGNDIGMSDEEYFDLLKKGGVELLNATKEARVREGETQKLLARYKAQGMSDAQAQEEVNKFWTEASASLERGYEIDENGNQIPLYGPGSSFTGAPFSGSSGSSLAGRSAAMATSAASAQDRAERQSAYDLLYSQFKLYGLESLVEPLKGLIITGASPAEFTIKLRDSDAYKLRFAANAKRIANGFKAIDEATYLGLEDRYQSIMQNYGLPESYYKKGSMGVQEGFEKFIANNVDPVTLEERIMEGVKINQGSKALIDTAKQFYPSLTDGDFLAYALDPKNALSEIRRKVTATEIGSAQIGAGLAATVGGAEELARAGITGKQYQQAAPTIAEASIRGGQLADIYKQSPYTQQTAESLLLDLPGSAEALKKTKKLTSLETAQFGGSAGAGAIARDRAGVL
jgi:hypothetical protein